MIFVRRKRATMYRQSCINNNQNINTQSYTKSYNKIPANTGIFVLWLM